MTRGARGRGALSGARGREVLDGPRSRQVLEGGRSRQVLTGPRGRTTGGVSYPDVFDESVLWLDSQYSVSGEPRVINRGTGGSALDAKYGSVLGTYVYDGAIVNAAATNNQASVPDNANLLLDDEFELVAHIAPDSWTTDKTIFGHSDAGGSRGWSLAFQTLGTPRLFVSTSGGLTNLPATAAVPFTAGQAGWVKATWIRNNGSGQYEIKYYTAADQPTEPSSWTQLGSTVTGATFAANATGPAVNVSLNGWASTANNWAGRYYRAIVRDGIDGTTVLDVDLADVADYATSFTATTGQTVTVNSTSSDTNDPLLLTHTGENYVYISDASAANGLSVPDQASFDLGTSDLDVRAEVTITKAPPSNRYDLFGRGNVDPNRMWVLRYNQNGTLGMYFVPTGSAASGVSVNSTAAVSYAIGERFWMRCTVDIDNGAGSCDTRFYTSDDGVTWTQLGSTITSGTATSWSATAGPVYVNLNNGANTPDFKFHRLVWLDDIDGSPLLDVNAAIDITDAGATSFTASSGQTVTVNRATSGRKTTLVTRPVWLFGTDDFLEVADNALLDIPADGSHTALLVFRSWATPKNFGRYLSRSTNFSIVNSGTTQGAYYSQVTGALPTTLSSPVAAGTLVAVGMELDNATELLRTFVNGTYTGAGKDTTGDGPWDGGTLQVGAQSSGNFQDFECVAVAVWRRALTADEIAAINTFYGTA